MLESSGRSDGVAPPSGQQRPASALRRRSSHRSGSDPKGGSLAERWTSKPPPRFGGRTGRGWATYAIRTVRPRPSSRAARRGREGPPRDPEVALRYTAMRERAGPHSRLLDKSPLCRGDVPGADPDLRSVVLPSSPLHARWTATRTREASPAREASMARLRHSQGHSGGGIRTRDLRVMEPDELPDCSTPRRSRKV